MKFSVTRLVPALVLIAIGVALCALGIYVGEIDDAPGAALMGVLLMFAMVALGVRTALRRPPAPHVSPPPSQPAEA